MELWRQIKNYEGLYDISSSGRVYSHITDKFLSASRVANHYEAVALYKNKKPSSRMVHLLVAEAFLPRDSFNKQVNHIDGNKYNNEVINLEWVTPAENSKHAIETGLFNPRGEGQWGSIQKEKDVIDILNQYGFEKTEKIAHKYGVTPSTITAITTGKNWKHLTSQIIKERKYRWSNIEKPCWKCKKIKPLKGFYRDSRNSDGLKSWCKRCFNTDVLERRQTKAKTMVDDRIRSNVER